MCESSACSFCVEGRLSFYVQQPCLNCTDVIIQEEVPEAVSKCVVRTLHATNPATGRETKASYWVRVIMSDSCQKTVIRWSKERPKA